MRGARRINGDIPLTLRIIPAYAGSTLALINASIKPVDHPRVCGEHAKNRSSHSSSMGSSPRMRGARSGMRIQPQLLGIIPAYAGSTYILTGLWLAIRDHPRVCGEHSPKSIARCVGTGSSPRMRGAHFEIPDIPMTWYMTGEFFIRFRRAWNCPPTQQGSSNTGLYGVGRPPR